MPAESATTPPLAGLCVVDAVSGPLAALTRILAELGATVLRIVPDDGDAIAALAANRGKQRATAAALSAADIIVENIGLDLEPLRAARPGLVTMTVSDFGTGSTLSDWQATGPVLHALSGALSRSGIRGRPPLLPPGDLAYQCAGVQAAYALLASHFHALRTGQGDHIDFAALDGAIQALDPGFGIHGSATLGRPMHLLSRDRPPVGFQYPILPCADGHVRLCVLAPRQWQGMFRWMGSPPQFADPAFNTTSVRHKSPELMPAIAAFLATRTRATLEAEGEQHGVPIAGLSSFAEVLETEQFVARASFAAALLPDGRTVPLPAGPIRVSAGASSAAAPDAATITAPQAFTGLKVLDLGIIVVGAEASRLFADQGADVVKIESRAFPDGVRQSHLPYGLSVSFAAGHRNKRSLGLDLREPQGRDLFLRLVADADVVLSNFKPGTLEALGLGPEVLAAANPRVVMVESSAFGASGPWRGRMGYGPLVRAATGLTDRWRYAGDPDGYCDSVTVYPDHAAGRMSAIAALALLVRRQRGGAGGHASIAQAEVMLSHFAAEIACAALGGDLTTDAPWGVYPTGGDDEWCVVTVRDDADWQRLVAIIGGDLVDPALEARAARVAARDRIDAAVGHWLATRTADAAMQALQAAGVPAARMLRIADLRAFDDARGRGLFRDEVHPHLEEGVVGEAWHARTGRLAPPEARPAPLPGEHSAAVLHDWLGLDAATIAALTAAGIVQPTDPAVYDAIAATLAARPAAAQIAAARIAAAGPGTAA
ncbi:MAG: acyl-CoA hydratase [Alphaproteobacteria bacterium]|nr:MAG: acyl-CoA hydratase [Alphaproteobacteria bacterium]